MFAGKKVAPVRGAGRLHADLPQAAHAGLRASVFDELKGKGIDTVACTAVNDIFVLTQWAKDTGADGKILCWPTATPIRQELGSTSICPALASACAPSAMPCWSTTAW